MMVGKRGEDFNGRLKRSKRVCWSRDSGGGADLKLPECDGRLVGSGVRSNHVIPPPVVASSGNTRNPNRPVTSHGNAGMLETLIEGGSHVTNVREFDVEDFTSWKDKFLVYLDGLEPYVLKILKNRPVVPKSPLSTFTTPKDNCDEDIRGRAFTSIDSDFGLYLAGGRLLILVALMIYIHRRWKVFCHFIDIPRCLAGYDNAAVIGILAHRDSKQRSDIEKEYQNMYSEMFINRLDGLSSVSGNLKIAVMLWRLDPAERDAQYLKNVLATDFINLETATEIICSRTSSQLQTVRQVYHPIDPTELAFRNYLEQDIKDQATGNHRKILLACVTKPRSEGMEVNREMAAKDAKALYKAGKKILWKRRYIEKLFVKIFTERSLAHLVAVNTCYHDMYGGSLKKAIKSETSGLFECALLTILQCAQNRAKYFAKLLYNSMQGWVTNDTTLRVIVTRTEFDMKYIKAEYYKKYQTTLNDAVHSRTRSHYQTFLLSLLGPEH
ncbi:annexin D5-like protein [Tanacetum coccineum]|uniref:Annexin D5-like protein n=1 Tax=Tanacetum coccineum TaxID=301880 RepID=A0ABQ4XZG9_9ASTR